MTALCSGPRGRAWGQSWGRTGRNGACTPVDRSTLPRSAWEAARTPVISAVQGAVGVRPELVRTEAWKANSMQQGGALGERGHFSGCSPNIVSLAPLEPTPSHLLLTREGTRPVLGFPPRPHTRMQCEGSLPEDPPDHNGDAGAPPGQEREDMLFSESCPPTPVVTCPNTRPHWRE